MVFDGNSYTDVGVIDAMLTRIHAIPTLINAILTQAFQLYGNAYDVVVRGTEITRSTGLFSWPWPNWIKTTAPTSGSSARITRHKHVFERHFHAILTPFTSGPVRGQQGGGMAINAFLTLF